nr:hypothetical protein CFP56_58794 [Quercus suber]
MQDDDRDRPTLLVATYGQHSTQSMLRFGLRIRQALAHFEVIRHNANNAVTVELSLRGVTRDFVVARNRRRNPRNISSSGWGGGGATSLESRARTLVIAALPRHMKTLEGYDGQSSSCCKRAVEAFITMARRSRLSMGPTSSSFLVMHDDISRTATCTYIHQRPYHACLVPNSAGLSEGTSQQLYPRFNYIDLVEMDQVESRHFCDWLRVEDFFEDRVLDEDNSKRVDELNLLNVEPNCCREYGCSNVQVPCCAASGCTPIAPLSVVLPISTDAGPARQFVHTTSQPARTPRAKQISVYNLSQDLPTSSSASSSPHRPPANIPSTISQAVTRLDHVVATS